MSWILPAMQLAVVNLDVAGLIELVRHALVVAYIFEDGLFSNVRDEDGMGNVRAFFAKAGSLFALSLALFLVLSTALARFLATRSLSCLLSSSAALQLVDVHLCSLQLCSFVPLYLCNFVTL